MRHFIEGDQVNNIGQGLKERRVVRALRQNIQQKLFPTLGSYIRWSMVALVTHFQTAGHEHGGNPHCEPMV
jgi:hypothetical protein